MSGKRPDGGVFRELNFIRGEFTLYLINECHELIILYQ